MEISQTLKIVVMSLFITLLTFVQAFVFNTALDILLADTRWLLVFIFSALIAVGSTYIYFISNNYSSKSLNAWYQRIGLWWGLLTNLFFGCLFYWPLLVVSGSVLVGTIPIILSIGIFFYGLKKAKDVVIKQLDIKIDNLPQYWQGKKIAFVTDLHLGKTLNQTWLKKILDLIEGQLPEILLIGGDLFDSTIIKWPDILEPFKHLNLVHGVAYVTGNHEYFIDYHNSLKPLLEDLDFNILDSNVINIEGLKIAGISHFLSKTDFNFKNEFSKLELQSNDPSILMYHEPVPKHVRHAMKAGIDLVLSGHTHYGQIAPFNILTWIYYGHFDYGLYLDKEFNNYQYTSSGVGSWGPPVRTTAAPEIAIITLK